MRRVLSLCCVCSVLSLSPSSRADEGDSEALPAPVIVRRSGFNIGIAGGLVLSAAHGFPNDVNKIGVAQYKAGTGLGVNRGSALWLGGSIVDWFSVGVGLAGSSNTASGTKSTGAAFQVRVETFPLFYQGRDWQDLGVLFCAGLGGYQIERGGQKVADGGATSALGFGAFYEHWRLWQLSLGPQLEYQHQFSHTISAQAVTLGLRIVFYGGP